MESMESAVYSISEAAKYLGVFPLTLRNWEGKGFIKSFRTPGGHRRYQKSVLDKIIGLNGTGEELRETIKKLEAMEFKNGRKQLMDNVITRLKTISEEI